jgi:hypothetical protein
MSAAQKGLRARRSSIDRTTTSSCLLGLGLSNWPPHLSQLSFLIIIITIIIIIDRNR